MSVGGVCAICESEPAVETCARCGSVVCVHHYEQAEGLCQECASKGM